MPERVDGKAANGGGSRARRGASVVHPVLAIQGQHAALPDALVLLGGRNGLHISADPKPIAKRLNPPLALSPSGRQAVIDELHNERFQDMAHLEIYTRLLGEGRYLCSPRTMYRILSAEHNGVKVGGPV
jgi:hypothetical protein